MEQIIGDKIVRFNQNLNFDGILPEGYIVLNPFLDNTEALFVMKSFYQKYYSDNNPRTLILGINPGRNGAGVTGVPFTDTKRLSDYCDIKMNSAQTHEISSVFIYDMIQSFGGVEKFYKQFYFNSPFPLAILRKTVKNKLVNANYYDSDQLFEYTKPFMIKCLKNHIEIAGTSKTVFVLGKKNSYFISLINKEAKLFENIVVLDHPRFIQQYRSKSKDLYIKQYIDILRYEQNNKKV